MALDDMPHIHALTTLGVCAQTRLADELQRERQRVQQLNKLVAEARQRVCGAPALAAHRCLAHESHPLHAGNDPQAQAGDRRDEHVQSLRGGEEQDR